jgi:hypothetical protein
MLSPGILYAVLTTSDEEKFSMKRLVEHALAIAETQLGVREEPPNSNQGPRVNEYLRTAGVQSPNPWCAAFVYWCIDQASSREGALNPFIRTAFCPTIESWARQHDILGHSPQAGDVFLNRSTVNGVFRASHTGFVISRSGASFETIEGNTNLDGSREGIGVFRRRRTNSSRLCFVRWGQLVEAAPDIQYELLINDQSFLRMPVRNGRALCPVRRWGERMGFEVGWNNEEQIPLFDGAEVATETALIDGVAYAPIRDLVESAGLKIRVDVPNLKVFVFR